MLLTKKIEFCFGELPALICLQTFDFGTNFFFHNSLEILEFVNCFTPFLEEKHPSFPTIVIFEWQEILGSKKKKAT